MPKYAIWDLDNCLSDDRHRIPLIRWAEADSVARYAEYHAPCGDDAPGNLDVFADFRARGIAPIFLTGRPLHVEQQTRDWIHKHLGIKPDWIRKQLGLVEPVLVMRNWQDRRRSVDVKREMVSWLWHYGVARNDIVAAFDDRADIVAMYRNEFLFDASPLRIHDVCAYTNPLNPKENT